METTSVAGIKRSEFETISRLVREASGINLYHGKEALVSARLAKRMRALGVTSFREYLELVAKDATRAELTRMVESITTNKTSFFRESPHFDCLRNIVLPSLLERRVRIWSAACSTGEEPYSIAISLKEFFSEPSIDARILATDINTKVLEKAKAAVYGEDILGDVPPSTLQRHFTCVEQSRPRQYRVNDDIRTMVRIAQLNLQDPWPMKGPFDVIFCRNVMIYFDKPTQQTLVNRFWTMLRHGGYLFVGHSESMARLKHEFQYIQPAVYLKLETPRCP